MKPPRAAFALLAALLCAAAAPAAAAGRGLKEDDDLGLPSRLSDLCASVVVDQSQFLPADGFTREVGGVSRKLASIWWHQNLHRSLL